MNLASVGRYRPAKLIVGRFAGDSIMGLREDASIQQLGSHYGS
jgi:hypothetical protein